MTLKEDCNKKQTYEEKELEILRNAVDNLEKSSKSSKAQSPLITKMVTILEKFLKITLP